MVQVMPYILIEFQWMKIVSGKLFKDCRQWKLLF